MVQALRTKAAGVREILSECKHLAAETLSLKDRQATAGGAGQPLASSSLNIFLLAYGRGLGVGRGLGMGVALGAGVG